MKLPQKLPCSSGIAYQPSVTERDMKTRSFLHLRIPASLFDGLQPKINGLAWQTRCGRDVDLRTKNEKRVTSQGVSTGARQENWKLRVYRVFLHI